MDRGRDAAESPGDENNIKIGQVQQLGIENYDSSSSNLNRT